MSYICRACSEIYDDSLKNNYCPKQRCGGDVSDLICVDSAFAAVIAEFNKKGLEIEYAEFGTPVNVVNDAPSIVFCSFLLDEFTEDEFKNDIFANLSSSALRVSTPIPARFAAASPLGSA